MKKVIAILFALGAVFIGITFGVPFFLSIAIDRQYLTMCAMGYLLLPGCLAVYFSRKEGGSIPVFFPQIRYVAAAIGVPFCILITATAFSFFFTGDANDSALLAPNHELTLMQSFAHSFSIGSNVALFTLFYALTVQLVIAFGEETMWRGYLLQKVQTFSFWKYAAGIGILKGLWQVPLIFFYGMLYPGHPYLGSLWIVIVSLLLSPLLLALRVLSKSLLPPVLFHAVFYALAALIQFIYSEPSHILGGMIGVSGFFILLLLNSALFLFLPTTNLSES